MIVETLKLHTFPDGYITQISDIAKWIDIFSEKIFHGRIQGFYLVELKEDKKNWATCEYYVEEANDYHYCSLSMTKKFRTFNHFLHVLVHECVHNYQWTYLKEEPDHGKTFWKWKNKLKKFDIPLLVEQ